MRKRLDRAASRLPTASLKLPASLVRWLLDSDPAIRW